MGRELEIYSMYEKLIYYLAWKYSVRYSYLEFDDLVSVGNLIFMEHLQEARITKRFPHSKFKYVLWWRLMLNRRKEGKFDYDKRVAEKFVNIDEIMAVDSETFNDIIFRVDLEKMRNLFGLEANMLIDCLMGVNAGVDTFIRKRVKRRMRLNRDGVINSIPRKKAHDSTIDDICRYMGLPRYKVLRMIGEIRKIMSKYLVQKDAKAI